MLGLVVGVIGLSVVQLYARFVHRFLSSNFSEGKRYFLLLSMYVVGYLFVCAAYRLLKSQMSFISENLFCHQEQWIS
jgi:hypothetical protein